MEEDGEGGRSNLSKSAKGEGKPECVCVLARIFDFRRFFPFLFFRFGKVMLSAKSRLASAKKTGGDKEER